MPAEIGVIPRSDVLRFAYKVVGVLGLTAFLYWAAYVWSVLPFGSRLFSGLDFFLPVVSLVAVGGVIAEVVGFFKAGFRSRTYRILAVWFAIVAGTVAGMWLGPIHRMQRIRHVAAAAMPLLQAIEAFERDEHRPPRDLAEILPRYLAAIPSTGMGGYPEWDYIHATDAHAYGENSWVLLVHTPGPGINFDQLVYFPNQRYPQFGHGGSLERLGTWAYVHE